MQRTVISPRGYGAMHLITSASSFPDLPLRTASPFSSSSLLISLSSSPALAGPLEYPLQWLILYLWHDFSIAPPYGDVEVGTWACGSGTPRREGRYRRAASMASTTPSMSGLLPHCRFCMHGQSKSERMEPCSKPRPQPSGAALMAMH